MREAPAIENSSRPPRQLHTTRLHVSRENAGVHSVSYSGSNKSPAGSSQAAFTGIAANPIVIGIFAICFTVHGAAGSILHAFNQR